MDSQNLSTILVALIVAGPTALAALGTQGHKARRMLKRLRAQAEVHEATHYATRREVRRHNDAHHPDGLNEMPVPELPTFMTDGDTDDEQ